MNKNNDFLSEVISNLSKEGLTPLQIRQTLIDCFSLDDSRAPDKNVNAKKYFVIYRVSFVFKTITLQLRFVPIVF